jgi:hypothetical protein
LLERTLAYSFQVVAAVLAAGTRGALRLALSLSRGVEWAGSADLLAYWFWVKLEQGLLVPRGDWGSLSDNL